MVSFWKSQHYHCNPTVLIFCYYIWNVQAHHMTYATTLYTLSFSLTEACQNSFFIIIFTGYATESTTENISARHMHQIAWSKRTDLALQDIQIISKLHYTLHWFTVSFRDLLQKKKPWVTFTHINDDLRCHHVTTVINVYSRWVYTLAYIFRAQFTSAGVVSITWYRYTVK